RLSRASSASASLLSHVSFSRLRPPPSSTLFPYTTLFRSGHHRHRARHGQRRHRRHRRHRGPRAPRDRDPRRHQGPRDGEGHDRVDRKSTRLNSSHRTISYAVFCLKKKKKKNKHIDKEHIP